MKKALVACLIVFAFSAGIFADFRADEKPVWNFYSPTAYTLKGGEWNLDLAGAITYGIGDFMQVGTNFWLWFPQFMNINAKINLLPEGDIVPALSVGGSFGQIGGGDNAFKKYNIDVIMSKTISKDMFISMGYNYAGNEFSGASSDFWNTILDVFMGNRYRSAIVIDFTNAFAPFVRGTLQATVNIGEVINYDAAAGVEFAIGDVFRLKVGLTDFIREPLTADDMWNHFWPFIDLAWRIK